MPRSALILGALWALSFSTSVQFLVVAPILPRIAEQLQVDEAALGALVTVYAIAFGVVALIAGPVSDRFGRRAILRWGSLGLTVALAAHGMVGSFAGLLVARAVAGSMSGMLSGASVAFIGDWFPYEERGRANGWIASSFAAGQIFGIPLGAVLAETGYRTPFLVFALTSGVASAMIWRWVPQPSVALADTLSFRGSIDAYRALLGRWDTRNAVLSYVAMLSGVSLFITYLPVWLEHRFDVRGPAVATLFMVGGVSNLFAGPIAGALSDRFGRKVLVVTGSTAAAALMAAMPWVVVRFELAYLFFFLVMISVGLRVAPQQSLVSSLVPPRQRGTLMALCFAIGQVGFATGSFVAGPLYASAWGFEGNAVGAGVAALSMAVIVAFGLPEPDGSADEA